MPRRRCRRRLAALVLCLMLSLLTSCAKTVYSEVPALTPPTWTADESVALADEYTDAKAKDRYPLMRRAVREYYAYREAYRAVVGAGDDSAD